MRNRIEALLAIHSPHKRVGADVERDIERQLAEHHYERGFKHGLLLGTGIAMVASLAVFLFALSLPPKWSAHEPLDDNPPAAHNDSDSRGSDHAAHVQEGRLPEVPRQREGQEGPGGA